MLFAFGHNFAICCSNFGLESLVISNNLTDNINGKKTNIREEDKDMGMRHLLEILVEFFIELSENLHIC